MGMEAALRLSLTSLGNQRRMTAAGAVRHFLVCTARSCHGLNRCTRTQTSQQERTFVDDPTPHKTSSQLEHLTQAIFRVPSHQPSGSLGQKISNAGPITGYDCYEASTYLVRWTRNIYVYITARFHFAGTSCRNIPDLQRYITVLSWWYFVTVIKQGYPWVSFLTYPWIKLYT